MTKKVNFYRQGLGLVPVSADPTGPESGQLQMSDGTVRAAGLWRYDGSDWVAVGSGGGGLDVFHTEDFESTGASDFTTGNAATVDAAGTGTLDGALADETVAPISSDASLKYTAGSSSTNDFFLQDADISLDLKQAGNDIGITFYYAYVSGSDDDIRFFVLDQDDNELTSSIEYLKSASTATRFSTSVYVPSGTTGLRYGFQVVSGTASAILIVDDFELSTNPFVYKNLLELTDWTDFTPTGSFTTNTTYTGRYRRVGSDMEIEYMLEFSGAPNNVACTIDMPSGFTIDDNSLLDPSIEYTKVLGTVGIYDSSASGLTKSGSLNYLTNTSFDVHTDVANATYLYAQSLNITSPITIASGDKIFIQAKVPIEGWSSSSEHVVTPAKSNMTNFASYTPTFQGFGTVSAVDIKYKQIGDAYLIQGTFTAGTVDTSEAQMTLPNSHTVNGPSSGDTVDCGTWVREVASTSSGGVCLITDGDSFINFSSVSVFSGSSSTATTPVAGNGVVASSQRVTISIMVPVQELTSDATFLAAVPTQKVAYLKDVKASGTDGGTATSGSWLTLGLNDVSGDSIASLSANQFTLGSGKYLIEWSSPFYDTNFSKTLLHDITNSVDISIGSNEFSQDTGSGTGSVRSNGLHTVELSASNTFELRYRVSVTKATNGLGAASSFGSDEVYTQVKITKLR